MTRVLWDQPGNRLYETGVDRGVLYKQNNVGAYVTGFPWNGLETVTESPSGAEATPTYADNLKYLNLISLEQFGGTIEAYTYPDEFAECDGSAELSAGVAIGQQRRKTFGLSYRSLLGNDQDGTDFGYKLHLVYGALAAPSEKAFATMNDSPEAITFSWDFTTTPVEVTGFKPTATVVINSTKVDPTALAALEDLLYGTVGTEPSLPLPDAVAALFAGSVTSVFPTAPTYVSGTHTLTIPTTTGVTYFVNGEIITSGAHVITVDTLVTAAPNAGYVFTEPSDDDWFFDFS